MLSSLFTVMVAVGSVLAAPLGNSDDVLTTVWVKKIVTVTRTMSPVKPMQTGASRGKTKSGSTHHHRTKVNRPITMLLHPTHTVSTSKIQLTTNLLHPILTASSSEGSAASSGYKFTQVSIPAVSKGPTHPKPTAKATQTAQAHSQTSASSKACPNSWPNGEPNFDTIPSSCGVSWLDTINTWRQAYHKSTLTWSPRLAQIAWNAGVKNQGGAQTGPFQHTNLQSAGSSGEIETPGYVIPPPGANLFESTPFEGAVLDWLCEVSGPELHRDGINLCSQLVRQTNNIIVAGQRGHHDVFLGDYKEVGCSFTFNSKNPQGLFAGAYVCDYGK